MKLMQHARMCALCQEPLKWWNAQACMECGKTICARHTYTHRRLHSTVLHSYCVHCSPVENKKSSTNSTFIAPERVHI